MSRIRIAAVTAGLVLAGGLFGTIAGTLVLLVWQIRLEGLSISAGELRWSLLLGVFFGGGPGALLGPLAAWMLMRHVPLWLAVGGTTLGTLTSGGVALVLTGDPVFAMAIGVVGFMMTSAALHNRFSPKIAA